MSERIKFHLDEHMGRAIAEALRRRGIDVTTTPDAELLSKSDPAQLDYCRQQSRVIVTADPDFIALASLGQDHAGIAFWPHAEIEVGEISRMLTLLWEIYDAVEMKNRIEYL